MIKSVITKRKKERKKERKVRLKMCGIAGIISSAKKNAIGSLLKRMLLKMDHRGPDGAGCVIDGNVLRAQTLKDLNLESLSGVTALGHVRLAITGESPTGTQPFQSENKKLTLLHNGEIYNYKELKKTLEPDHKFITDSDSEVILKLIEKNYKGSLVDAAKEVLPLLDGVYALAVTDNTQTVIARDKIGVRQFYYSKGENHFAFASEKKPLINLNGGNEKTERLLPGHIAVFENGDMLIECFWKPETLAERKEIIHDEKTAIDKYDKVLKEAVRKRIDGRKNVGIVFSGGIDSLLIAYLVQKMDVPFTCYTAGREGGPDLKWAKEIAEFFKFPLKVKNLEIEDIEGLIPQIIHDIEDQSLNQVEVSVPIYAAVQMAREEGERVLLNGQGPDELFGGYPWYPKIVGREGYDSFERYSFEDTFLLYKECLEREDKIAMAHSIEIRVPFLDPKVIKLAFHIAPELKISGEDDRFMKRIHRNYALSQGIPENIAFRIKEAAQHGANVHSAFEELSGKTGVTKEMLISAGYDPAKTVTEKLGSSSRYGYKYGDIHLWEPLPQVQYYLDCVADKLGLFDVEKSRYLAEIKNRL